MLIPTNISNMETYNCGFAILQELKARFTSFTQNIDNHHYHYSPIYQHQQWYVNSHEDQSIVQDSKVNSKKKLSKRITNYPFRKINTNLLPTSHYVLSPMIQGNQKFPQFNRLPPKARQHYRKHCITSQGQ